MSHNDRITWHEVEYYARQKAWEKTGYRDFESVKKAARKLKDEEKLDILFEIFEEEIARKYFANKTKFQKELGRKLVVTREELLDWTKETFPNYEIIEYFFDDYHINPETLAFERAPKEKK